MLISILIIVFFVLFAIGVVFFLFLLRKKRLVNDLESDLQTVNKIVKFQVRHKTSFSKINEIESQIELLNNNLTKLKSQFFNSRKVRFAIKQFSKELKNIELIFYQIKNKG